MPITQRDPPHPLVLYDGPLRIKSGGEIGRTIHAIAEYAQQTGRTQTVNHNGIPVTACPGDSPKTVGDRWAALKSRAIREHEAREARQRHVDTVANGLKWATVEQLKAEIARRSDGEA